jgi:hypothetical protein
MCRLFIIMVLTSIGLVDLPPCSDRLSSVEQQGTCSTLNQVLESATLFCTKQQSAQELGVSGRQQAEDSHVDTSANS